MSGRLTSHELHAIAEDNRHEWQLRQQRDRLARELVCLRSKVQEAAHVPCKVTPEDVGDDFCPGSVY